MPFGYVAYFSRLRMVLDVGAKVRLFLGDGHGCFPSIDATLNSDDIVAASLHGCFPHFADSWVDVSRGKCGAATKNC